MHKNARFAMTLQKNKVYAHVQEKFKKALSIYEVIYPEELRMIRKMPFARSYE
jgi:hypothetical protein